MAVTQPVVILRRPSVQACTGMSRSQLYDMCAKGTFPTPIRLSRRTVGWIESEVQAFLQARIEESRAQPLGVKTPAVAKSLNGKDQS